MKRPAEDPLRARMGAIDIDDPPKPATTDEVAEFAERRKRTITRAFELASAERERLAAESATIGPVCHGRTKLVDGSVVYPHRPDLFEKRFWLCACGAFVGCHPGTTEALGAPADARTRRARSAAHEALDALWRNPRAGMTRRQVYSWLSRELQIGDPLHVGSLSAEECDRVVDLCNARRARSYESPLAGADPNGDYRVRKSRGGW